MERLFITGYRDWELGIFSSTDPQKSVIKYALTNYLKNQIENHDLKWLISGANLGVEQWALEVGLELKVDYDLKVSMMVPYLDFEKHWKDDKQTNFNLLKGKVDFFASTSNKPYDNFKQLKNYQTFMRQHTDSALMVYDPEFEGKPKYDYAYFNDQDDYQLDLISMDDLTQAAEDYQEGQQEW